MKILFLSLLMSGFVFSNCETSKKTLKNNETETVKVTSDTMDNEKSKSISDELTGSWEWIKTDCCGRTTKTTYASPEAEKRVITFYEDGTVLFYSVDPEGKMEKQKYTKGMMGEQETIKIGTLQPAIMEIENDTLVLNWGYFDLQIEYYKRLATK
jgi:hypothetical protein